MKTIREMTPGEKYAFYVKSRIPCGHSFGDLLVVSEAGICANVTCSVCGLELNVFTITPVSVESFGQVLYEPQGYLPPTDTGLVQPAKKKRLWFNPLTWSLY